MSIYYNPKDHGLEIIDSMDDPNSNYSYDMFVVWRNIKTGELLWGQDSG